MIVGPPSGPRRQLTDSPMPRNTGIQRRAGIGGRHQDRDPRLSAP